MMETFVLLAAKSLLVAGGALVLLQLMRNRSAADRSWIAHLALVALLLLPVATIALPSLDVQGPSFLVGEAKHEVVPPAAASVDLARATDTAHAAATGTGVAEPSANAFQGAAAPTAPIDWSFWAYVLPAALLVLFTLIALARLFVLKSRATVLVEPEWLTALARAQHRMGFKHGTALLTSDELPSPISWGVIRPVILLNTEAAKSHSEAEAIITHELAHVARLDWAKLMVSRVAVALFWFNPLVWLLAREAHQLREEAADDAVLAADIEDTDYARLLVGVARHECRGLLIGAHGVAPGKNSLSRRIKRVLDGAVKRAPGGWRWGSAAAFFAAGMAVPVAALNLVPASAAATEDASAAAGAAGSYYPGAKAVVPALGDLPAIVGKDGAAAAAAAAAGAAVVSAAPLPRGEADRILSRAVAPNGATVTTMASGLTIARAPSGATTTIYPPDRNGRSRVVAVAPSGAMTETYARSGRSAGLAAALAHPHPPAPPAPPSPLPRSAQGQISAIDRAIAIKAVGASPEYIAAIRAAAPQLRLDSDEIVGMKAVGVTPEFVRELAHLGYRNLDADEITGAYAVGVRANYVRSLAAAGYNRLTLDQLTSMRAMGVTARDIEGFRKAGFGNLTPDKLVELKAMAITPEELKASTKHSP